MKYSYQVLLYYGIFFISIWLKLSSTELVSKFVNIVDIVKNTLFNHRIRIDKNCSLKTFQDFLYFFNKIDEFECFFDGKIYKIIILF